MRKHVQVLGILNIIWGSISLLAAVIVFLIFGGVMGLIGMTVHNDPGARLAIPIIGIAGGILVLILALTSIPSITAGIGLLKLSPWARILTIIVSALHLFSIPFGTALGIYGLWVMLNEESLPLFQPVQNPVHI